MAIALARLRGALEWRFSSSRRTRSEAIASAILGRPKGDPETRRLGRRYLEEKAMQSELSWRPWSAREMEVEGLHHLKEAEARGKGVLLAGMHFGPMLSAHLALAARGFKIYLSGGHPPEESVVHGYSGLWVKTQNLWMEQAGNRWVHKGNSFVVLREVLLQGGICWLAWDTIGRDRQTTYLGRKVRVQSGIARLHIDTGAPVLPVIALREGWRMRTVIGAPVEFPEGAGEGEINEVLGRVLGDLVSPDLAQLHYQSAVLFELAAEEG
jgi:lauroyl/myristoyl acyltransferase